MQITPNYHFNGNCEEALHMYEKAFNGKITILLKNNDANPEDMTIDNMSVKEKSFVYHAEMVIGNQRFMFSDSSGNLPEGTNISIVITFETDEEVLSAYTILKTGGKIIHPVKSTTYSNCFISLIDKFGMRWELMTEKWYETAVSPFP